MRRQTVTTFFVPELGGAGEITLSEAAAHHARVRRLASGGRVRLVDGKGGVAHGVLTTVGKREVLVAVESVMAVPPMPPIHMLIPVADRDRMLLLVEKCTELGVASCTLVRFRRSSSVTHRGEGTVFLEKLKARMVAALEQSGGAWLPDLGPPLEIEQAARVQSDSRIVLDPEAPSINARRIDAPVAIVVGPEGGIEPAELALLESEGWEKARIEGNMLRFETAAVAAAAIVRARLGA